MSLVHFSVLATLFIMRLLVDIYLTQRFIIAWRMWLTAHLTDDWLNGRAYYRDLFIDNTIDNPDQRIQQDVDIFTTGVGATPNIPSNETANTLLFGAVRAVVSVVSFAAILWHLSGRLDVFGFQIPRAMFWIVLVYVLIATSVAFWLGRPLIWLSFNNEKLNAAFRYALVRLRDAAEAVGFYRGERVERAQLWGRFMPIIGNYRGFVRRTIVFNGWNWSMSQAIVPLPWVIQAPRLFAGQIAFGDVGQTATAFGEIHDSLSFFRNQYDAFAAFRAAIIRLHGLVDANAKGRDLPAVLTRPTDDGSVEFDGVEVRTPDGDPLVDALDVRLESGETLVITGQSGAGKTTLLRSLAELWPYASGTLRCPDGDNATMFLSQLPYVPLGTSTDRGVLSELAGRHFRRVVARHLGKGSVGAAAAIGSTKSVTGPRCSPPVSSNGWPSHASCSPNPKRCFWTRARRRSTRAWNTRCISCCTTNYRTALWSASATDPRSSCSTIDTSSCSAAARGGWAR